MGMAANVCARRCAALRRPLARALSSASSSASHAAAQRFDAWLQQSAAPPSERLTPAAVRSFLGVSERVDPAALSLPSRREIVTQPQFVEKIGAATQWCFQAHHEATEAGDEARLEQLHAVFEELMPWGNMAKGDVWQHFYVRRFFLSRAPLKTFLACYEVHRSALERAGERFLPLPAALLMRELCWRGRFAETLDAYTQLPLDDSERRSFTALLFEYEQFATLRQVYALQDEIDASTDRETPLLDPLFILHALKELGLRDELMDRFEDLPHEDQGRADVQKLLADA